MHVLNAENARKSVQLICLFLHTENQELYQILTVLNVQSALLCVPKMLFHGLVQGIMRMSERPNILLITADDMNWDAVGAYGCPVAETTPNIDQLAAQGMRMTQFYANCTVCSPSRASLLTGRYPDMVGVPGVIRQFKENSWGYLDPQAVLIPEALSSSLFCSTRS